jgi:hypothetical protein
MITKDQRETHTMSKIWVSCNSDAGSVNYQAGLFLQLAVRYQSNSAKHSRQVFGNMLEPEKEGEVPYLPKGGQNEVNASPCSMISSKLHLLYCPLQCHTLNAK